MLESTGAGLDTRIAQRRARCQRAHMPLAMLRLQLQDRADWHARLGEALASGLCREWARRVQRRVRDTDEVLLLGDGDIAVLLPGASAADAAVVQARLQDALAAPFQIGRLLLSPGVQVACAHWPVDAPAPALPKAWLATRGATRGRRSAAVRPSPRP